jgi:hypothetical protein
MVTSQMEHVAATLRTFGPSHERWARAVLVALHSPRDLTTVASWAQVAGASETRLRTWCRLARSRTKASLDLARILRALLTTSGLPGADPADALDVADDRTLRSLLRKAGLAGVPPSEWSIGLVLRGHRLAIDRRAITALALAMGVDPPPTMSE